MSNIKAKKSSNGYLNGHTLSLDDLFVNPTKGALKIPEMIKDMDKFVSEDPTGFYSLIIGTDSQARRNGGEEELDYVSAIVFYRKGKGARYYFRKIKTKGKVQLRNKIYTETLMSLDVAHKVVPLIRAKISPAKYDLEIHIDVGPLGPTRDMIKEVVGMVTGSGYVAKTKPFSWGASSVADKHA
jgi:predicted RNase H-related nuclease YkuK (DUF458 family)